MNRIAYVVTLISVLGACSTPSSKNNDLGYKGYNKEGEAAGETLDRLKSDPKVKVRMDRGWTIVNSDSGRIIWSFTPEEHPAHPSYVKREVIEKNGAIYINTSARCGAEKQICDKLVQDFIDLNNKVRENIGKE